MEGKRKEGKGRPGPGSLEAPSLVRRRLRFLSADDPLLNARADFYCHSPPSLRSPRALSACRMLDVPYNACSSFGHRVTEVNLIANQLGFVVKFLMGQATLSDFFGRNPHKHDDPTTDNQSIFGEGGRDGAMRGVPAPFSFPQQEQ